MKKIIYPILLIIFIIISYFSYTIIFPKSPLKTTKKINDIALIEYSSPSKNDRLIFGNKDEGALVPFGEYWRTGANRHTFIENKKTLIFTDRELNKDYELKPGKYSIYTIPSKDSWEIFFNSEVNFLGINRPSVKYDLFSITVESTPLLKSIEDFSIEFDELGNNQFSIDFAWDKTKVTLFFRVK